VRILVVDDEAPARRRLVRLLEDLDGVEVVGEAENGAHALEQVARVAPELLLLDIHMPGIDGLELAAMYTDLPPVVFVTAHDEHALRAFEVHAVDYLLKPVRAARLAEAIVRARARVGSAAESFRALGAGAKGAEVPRVVTHERGVHRLFDVRAITRFWASEKYTVFLFEGAEHMTAEPLAALEERLVPWGFLRVHRAELVRVSAVRALTAEGGGAEARLEDGQVARVSRRFVPALKKQLGL